LLLSNALELRQARLEFLTPEHSAVWSFVEAFVSDHNHVPDISSLQLHFTQTEPDPDVINQLQLLRSLPAITRGDFKKRLTIKVEELKTREVEELLSYANIINRKGVEEKEEGQRGRGRILKGYRDALQHITRKSLDIIRPTAGVRKEGEVTTDTHLFIEDYDRRKNDPTYGKGQLCGLPQIDETTGGARKDQLWTHAAFTGELKCLTSETLIQDAETGTFSTIEELYRGGLRPLVQCLDEVKWETTYARVGHVEQNARVPIFKITTNAGRVIRASGNHPFLTVTGWKNAEDLNTEQDFLAIPEKWSTLPLESTLRDEEVKLLGYLLGDGCLKGYIDFTNTNPSIQEDFVQCLEALGYAERTQANVNQPTYHCIADRSCYRVSHNLGDRFHPNRVSPLRVLLENLGLWGRGSYEKHIPRTLWQTSDAQIWMLLGALWATDGSISTRRYCGKRKVNLYYASVSESLARDVYHLLHRVGVQATVRRHALQYKNSTRHCWQVKVMSCSWWRFLTYCHPAGKVDQMATVLEVLSKEQRDPRMPSSLLKDVDDSVRWWTKAGGWRYARWAKRRKTLLRGTLHEVAKKLGSAELLRKCEGDILWEKVESVDPDGVEMTYDLSVPAVGNFVANGFLVHNSTFAFNWVYNQAIYFGESSCYFSLEMPYEQCQRIIYTMHSMHEKFRDVRMALGLQKDPDNAVPLTYHYIRDGKLPPNEERFLKEFVLPDLEEGAANGIYGKMHFRGYDPDSDYFRISDMRAKAETLYRESSFSLLVADHVLLIDAKKNHRSTTESANEVVRDLKKLSEVFNAGEGIAVLALFQISREGKKRADKAEGRYSLYDLSYSNEIERSSDVITGSYLNDELRKRCRALFQFLKSRDGGMCDPFYTRVDWPSRMLFTCHERPGTEAESVVEEVEGTLYEELFDP